MIVPACSPIPPDGLIVTSSFGTSRDNQTGADIEICEGEERYFDDNTHLGEFELSGLPQRGRGEITINVTMSIDTDGILTVSGFAEGTDIKRDIAVRANKGRLDEANLLRLQEENEEYARSRTSATEPRARARAPPCRRATAGPLWRGMSLHVWRAACALRCGHSALRVCLQVCAVDCQRKPCPQGRVFASKRILVSILRNDFPPTMPARRPKPRQDSCTCESLTCSANSPHTA